MKEKIISKSEIRRKVKSALYINTNIVITDNRTVLIENCKHILECNDIMIKLVTADYNIEVWGNDLVISDFNTGNVVVNGTIASVSISVRAGRGEK